MGRPPCCDKVGIKKGPWTPEEDIILVSYIQEHGPGNWRSVPTNTGLFRCSKSCRLRWTNYLRPGIKRGNFTPHEEGMIIHLQALLGNKWAAIASYLPQRTDNDIKNYWNTHLKKKIKKFQNQPVAPPEDVASRDHKTCYQLVSKSYGEKRSKNIIINQASSAIKLNHQISTTTSSTYASSTENISRLLEGWMKTSPKAGIINKLQDKRKTHQSGSSDLLNYYDQDHTNHPLQCIQLQQEENCACGDTDEIISHDEVDFESLLPLQHMASNIYWEKYPSTDSGIQESQTSPFVEEDEEEDEENENQRFFHPTTEIEQLRLDNQHPPLSLLEKWLLDEAASTGQVEGIMYLSPPPPPTTTSADDNLPNM